MTFETSGIRLDVPVLEIYRNKTIRIFQRCESGIEKSVTMITVRHHEACKVITSDGFFYPILTQIIDSCSPLNTTSSKI